MGISQKGGIYPQIIHFSLGCSSQETIYWGPAPTEVTRHGTLRMEPVCNEDDEICEVLEVSQDESGSPWRFKRQCHVFVFLHEVW